jgi:hypothetical protein
MAFLREIFGPSKSEVWRRLAEEIGAEFVEGGSAKGQKVIAAVGKWTITLETYTTSMSDETLTYTRLLAPYVNKDGFRFLVKRKGPFIRTLSALEMPDVKVGYPEFARGFTIKANDEAKLDALLANPWIRELIRKHRAICLHASDDIWSHTDFREGFDELRLEVIGVIKDLPRLKSLYELLALTLKHLHGTGSAAPDGPDLELRVRKPGGR